MPWAAILHARVGNGEAAALLLENFRRVYMTPGYATTHDARFAGFSNADARPDVMQVDAAEGAAAAVLEMLLHTAHGVLRVFPAVPPAWETASFRGVRAEGAFEHEGGRLKIVDLPGTYSLQAGSADEEVARDFVLFGRPDVTVVVVDATRLERNLNLVLQILEITDRVVIFLNLVDEARRHGIAVDPRKLESELGVPVVAGVARQGAGIDDLIAAASYLAARDDVDAERIYLAGHATGATLALLCDIRLAAPDTVLGLPETKLGMLPAAGGTQSLTRAIGPVAALPIIATAENLSAADAMRRGLVHRVVDDVEAEAMAIARRWAALPPGPLRAARMALRAAGDLPLEAGLTREGQLARRA